MAKENQVTGDQTDILLPPSDLMHAVAGTPDSKWFLKSGKLSIECITQTLAKNNADINQFRNILDFGCGSGRVLRHWKQLPSRQFYGSDYNPKLVEWCEKNLPQCKFNVNKLGPGLPYKRGKFDLIYAISIFTHLTDELQMQWMREIYRLLRSGGYFLFTTHGKYYFERLPEDQKQKFSMGELIVQNPQQVGTNDCGSFHPTEYVNNKLSKGFVVVDFIPSGFTGAPYQDLWLFQKKDKSLEAPIKTGDNWWSKLRKMGR
jgi:SAM-dependent methyltransferase